MSDKSALEIEIRRLGPWFHNLHLPDGTETLPDHGLGDFPAARWKQIASHLPEELEGWRVLDIGCNAGFYSIALAQRGASVLAIDHEPHFLAQARWAIDLFGLSDRIELRQTSIYGLARERARFDLVLFMGVFYHLRHPLLGLDIAADRAERFLVFQTLSRPGEEPKMSLVEGAVEGAATHWWVPNHAGILTMLRSTGLKVLARPGHSVYLCEPIPDRRTRVLELTEAA
jgi:tRNA (mo5U34)-methyltransferase